MIRAFVRVCATFSPIALLAAACAVETEPTTTVASESDDLKVKVCPKIAIMCAEGYIPKTTGGCNWTCIPDKAAKDCSVDSECPQIYCFTTPCPQYVCRGHKCVQENQPPQGGEQCGSASCGAGSYCCNALCSMCAPDGMFCIQGCAEAF
jgi:hypothetical protein